MVETAISASTTWEAHQAPSPDYDLLEKGPTPDPLRVLLIEDNPGDVMLVKAALSEEGPEQFKLSYVEQLSSGLSRLSEEEFDVILLDLSLPDAFGIDTVARLYERSKDIPIVVLTGANDELLGIKAVHAGAQDYLVKGYVTNSLLIHSIRYAIERHRMGAELEQSRQEQLRLKDQFLSHVSHELRSPLTSIYEFTTILLDRIAGEINDEQREYLGVIMNNVKQFRSMIDALLDVTRAQAGKLVVEPQSISLDDVIRKTVASFEAALGKKKITPEIELPVVLPPAYADPDRVAQVLRNLLDNAIKFTPSNGELAVQASVSTADPNFLCVSVSDSGCGISPEGTERVFNHLYQEKNSVEMSRRGLGLGLFICRELISRQGGKIWVESTAGHGSTFYFTLPIFSLPQVLHPIVLGNKSLPDNMALIEIDVSPLDTSGSHTLSEGASREIWNVLRSCILPCFDGLLPRMPRSTKRETFYIVARTDRRGAEQIIARVRGQIESHPAMYDANLNLATSVSIVETNCDQSEKPLEEAVNDITSRIVALINAGMYERGILA